MDEKLNQEIFSSMKINIKIDFKYIILLLKYRYFTLNISLEIFKKHFF